MIDKMDSVKSVTAPVNIACSKEDKFKVIKSLKTIFGGAEQFILTGSSVVKLQGFHMLIEGDIDICIFKPTEATLQLLKRHVAEYAVRRNNEKLMERGIYIFSFQGWKVDVFITNQRYDDKLQYDGVIISSVLALANAKKTYHRLKDILQLREWARQIFDNNFLDQELKTVVMEEEYNVNN